MTAANADRARLARIRASVLERVKAAENLMGRLVYGGSLGWNDERVRQARVSYDLATREFEQIEATILVVEELEAQIGSPS